jgi:hypothetical protein
MALHLLLVSRRQSGGFSYSFPRLVIAPAPVLDPATLAWLVQCPPEALTFTRVGPVHLAHGGTWAQARELPSFCWGLADQPVIHGNAVGIRVGMPFPGDPPHLVPPAYRALTDWEARNALHRFQDHFLPLGLNTCQVHERFLGSIGFPLHEQFHNASLEAQYQIRTAVMAERRHDAELFRQKLEAEITARRLQEQRTRALAGQ